MNLSFFAYIEDSTHPKFPASTIIKMTDPLYRGNRVDIVSSDGDYSLIGLDAITYEDEADLVHQVNAILKELDL